MSIVIDLTRDDIKEPVFKEPIFIDLTDEKDEEPNLPEPLSPLPHLPPVLAREQIVEQDNEDQVGDKRNADVQEQVKKPKKKRKIEVVEVVQATALRRSARLAPKK